MADHRDFMRLAIAQARAGLANGEQPFGTVIASDNEIVSQTYSQKVALSDPTAHAETLAIRATSHKLKRTLGDCTLYTTCEPCPMCLGAMLNAGVKRLVLGARLRDLSTVNRVFAFGNYSAENFAAMLGWDLEVSSGILTEECIELYRQASVPLTR